MRRLLLLVACACNTAPAHRTTPVTLTAPTAIAAAPLTSPDACARIREEQRTKTTTAIAESRKQDPGEWEEGVEKEVREAILSPTGMGLTCLPFARGAWALETKEITVYPRWRSAAADLVAVAHVGGARAESREPFHAGYGGEFTYAAAELASDYDGDGVPELWVHTNEDGVEGGHSETGTLLTFHDGLVQPYAPAASLGDMAGPRDVDGDGRMDFPTDLGIELGEDIACMGKSDWRPAEFLAHALPNGTFSASDAVAKRWVMKWCGEPPKSVESAQDALCARLWGKPRTLATACVKWDCQLENDGKPQPKGARGNCQARADAYDASPPFTLP